MGNMRVSQGLTPSYPLCWPPGYHGNSGSTRETVARSRQWSGWTHCRRFDRTKGQVSHVPEKGDIAPPLIFIPANHETGDLSRDPKGWSRDPNDCRVIEC